MAAEASTFVEKVSRLQANLSASVETRCRKMRAKSNLRRRKFRQASKQSGTKHLMAEKRITCDAQLCDGVLWEGPRGLGEESAGWGVRKPRKKPYAVILTDDDLGAARRRWRCRRCGWRYWWSRWCSRGRC